MYLCANIQKKRQPNCVKPKTLCNFAAQKLIPMKRNYFYAVLMLAALIVSCGSKEEPKYIIVEPEKEVKQKPQTVKTETYKYADTLKWKGKIYNYEVVRECDEEAVVVKADDGQKYFDNKATITVKRSDGSVFYSNTFHKSTFAQSLSPSLSKKGILEGVVYEKSTDNYIQFSASVALPQSDEFVPFAIRISTDGSINIVRVNNIVDE